MTPPAKGDGEERAYLVPHEGALLYRFLHGPVRAESPPVGSVLIAPPHPWEHQGCDRMFVLFARTLASAGFSVLRFDYRGTRESTGDPAASTVRSQVADVLCAANELARAAEGAPLTLLGARFGATLAYLAAQEMTTVGSLVLWDPIVEGQRYFSRCLRAAMTSSGAEGGAAATTREALVQELAAGRAIDVGGYCLGAWLYAEGIATDLAALAPGRPLPTLVLQTGTQPPRESDPTQAFAQRCIDGGEASRSAWVEEGAYWAGVGGFGVIDDRPQLTAETLSWLCGRSPT